MGDRIFASLIYASTALIALIFLWILGDIVFKGLAHLSFGFLLNEPSNAGREGGILTIIISTALILFVAIIAAVPFGLSVAIWLAEFSKTSGRANATTRLTLDVLAGVPSIVYGLFGNAFFCIFLGLGFSILSGGLTLACMILPIFIRTAESGFSAVNRGWRSGAAALGMSKASAIWHILLPSATPAIMAGLVLGIGRATAETAALIFTAGYVDRMPDSLMDSGRALSVHIYDLSMNVTGGDPAAYASALTLIAVIILFNILAQSLTDQWLARKVKIA